MIDLAQRSEPYEIALPYGSERTDAGLSLDGLPDLSTEGERDGFYQVQLIHELAVRHITSWTSVEREGGPAPPSPENIAAVMELYPVGERFFQEFTLRQVLLNAAKNGLSAAGTSSPAEGPNTAEPAATTACPAPETSVEPTGALPLPRARLQPPGARGMGRAARLPGPAAARAERPRDRYRYGRGAEDRRGPRL